MENVFVDVNGRTVQVSKLSVAENFTTGVCPDYVKGIVRIKNIGSELGIIQIDGMSDDGIYFSAGETEYLAIKNGDKLSIVSGEFNIMY